MGVSKVVGISLGSSSCRMGILVDNGVQILENEHGKRSTPSCVAFTGTQRLIGEAAWQQITENPCNTVFGFKRYLGQNSKTVLEEAKKLKVPYQLETDEKNRCSVRVKQDSKEINLFPEQLFGMILAKMKRQAETTLNTRLHQAVISVPPTFHHFQRLAVIDAGKIAGFEKIELINDCTAAAIAYSDVLTDQNARYAFILDFGGGFMTVCLAFVWKGKQISIESAHTEAVGGFDLDLDLLRICSKKIHSENGFIISEGKALETLRSSCETARKSLLQNMNNKKARVFCSVDKSEVEIKVERSAIVDQLLANLRKLISGSIETVLTKANVQSQEVHHVILVGGVSRTPCITKIIEEHFPTATLSQRLNPEEVVAHGASIRGAMLGKEYLGCLNLEIKDSVHRFVTVSTEELILSEIKNGDVSLFGGGYTIPEIRKINVPFNENRLIYEINRYGKSGDLIKIGSLKAGSISSVFHYLFYSSPNFKLFVNKSGIVKLFQIDYPSDDTEATLFKKIEEDELLHMIQFESELQALDHVSHEMETKMLNLEYFCYKIKKEIEQLGDSVPGIKANWLEQLSSTLSWLGTEQPPSKDEILRRIAETKRMEDEVKTIINRSATV